MLEGDSLNSGMVTDFKHLNWFKVFLDDVLDHKFIMDISDPLIPHEVPEYVTYIHNSGTVDAVEQILDMTKCVYHAEDYWTPDLTHLLAKDGNQAVVEKYEGMIFVDFVPTSENLSAWLLGIAQKKMAQLDVKVTAVEFWETPKSHCRVEV
jgi:6-pyruvoyltetrahydropterin/6-carboxytetrahydropterin synthase